MMSADAVRWVAAMLLVLFAVGLLVWGRGVSHHRGDDVGALDVQHVAARSLVQ
jgi:hypothetical protein